MIRPLGVLRFLLGRKDREEILGDLEEGYGRRVRRVGESAARRWLWRQVLTTPPRLWVAGLLDRAGGAAGTGFGKGAAGRTKDLFRDVRIGLRGLRRRPVFAVTAVLTLAIGAGMTTTLFTLVDAVVLRPLPGDRARGLVYLGLESENGDLTSSPTPELLRLIRDHAGAFARVEGYAMENITLGVNGEPLRVLGGRASEGFFSLLGVRAELGRLFRPGDGRADAGPVAVLSHTFWQEHFGGRRDVLGQVVISGRRSYVVTGVLPRDFHVDSHREAQLWTAEGSAGDFFANEESLEGALARLADGMSLAAARAELAALVAHDPLTQRAGRQWVARIKTQADLVDPALRRAVLLLQAGAVLVLLIACGNLANLLLAQGEGRAREFALRASLGAGKGRLIRQMLTECALLGVAGASAGALLAVWALNALPLFIPPGFGGFSLHTDGFLLSVGVSMLGVFAAGLAPALRGVRQSPGEVIKGADAGRRGRTRGGRQLLVAGQVAMAFVLLFSAGLLFESFTRLMTADPGFRRDDLLSARIELPSESYPDDDARREFLHRLRDELRARIPEPLGAATVATGLVDGVSATFAPLALEGSADESGDPLLLITWGVAPDYFGVVGVPVTEGRAFTETDGREGEKVVIVNDGVARRYFAGSDPVGRRLRIRDSWYRVVGVAGTVRLPRFARSAFGDLQLFFPLAQDAADDLTVLARIRGDRPTTVKRVRAAIRAVDPFLPILKVSLAEDALAASLFQERSHALVSLLFAVTALLLGAVGIYGVVAYSVGRQVREIGIRIALGATRGGEVARVVARGMKSVAVGLAAGVVGAVALGPALTDFLHEVGPRDPWVSAGAALVVSGVAFLATWIPARRVAAAHPSRALRAE